MIESDGGGGTLDTVDLDITSGGVVTASSPVTLADSDLRMTPDKELIFGVVNDTEDGGSTPNYLVAVRIGTPATTADLEGTWTHFAFSDNAIANAPMWSRSVFTLDAMGTAVSGSKTDSLGGAQDLSGGSLSVDAGGRVNGTLSYGTLATDRFVAAKLNTSADLFAGVASGLGGGDDRRIISVATLPEPGGPASLLAALLALSAARHRLRRTWEACANTS